MILDLAALKTLVTAVDLKGFGRAAERLHRSPAAVTLQIKALEELLQVKLFVKAGRQHTLTEAGETLVAHARRLLQLNDETLLALQTLDLDGEVRFGMPQDFADGWLPSTLAQFARAHRAVRVRVQVGRSTHIAEQVGTGELDLGLAFKAAGGADTHTLGQMPQQWFAGAGFELPPGEPVPLLVLDPPCLFRQSAIEALDQAGRPWRIALTSVSVSALWAAAQAGLGVTPRIAIHHPAGVEAASYALGLPALPPVALALLKENIEQRPAAAHLARVVEEVVQARMR